LFDFLCPFLKNIQNEVVSAVNAESVVAKVAAVKPNKIIDGISAKWLKAISGKSKSVLAFQ
jgi:hypothetical protein